MPRLPTRLLVQARALNPLLVPLLKTCRTLPSARNELRWLQEHVARCTSSRHPDRGTNIDNRLLKQLCFERGRGKPLQYLLGTEYFGDLELVCRPGVLIPRPDTAAVVIKLARRLETAVQAGRLPSHLRILDLCTGTGCMALLLHSELQKSGAHTGITSSTLGIDVSLKAVQTARLNNRRLGFSSSKDDTSCVSFALADILAPQTGSPSSMSSDSPNNSGGAPSLEAILQTKSKWQEWDVIMSNPPYISPETFSTKQVEKSVRMFEPRTALVPPMNIASSDFPASLEHPADSFYPRVLDVARVVGAKVVLVEVGDREQALRVKGEAVQQDDWAEIDILSDGLNLDSQASSGVGQDRAVICWRAEAAERTSSYYPTRLITSDSKSTFEDA